MFTGGKDDINREPSSDVKKKKKKIGKRKEKKKKCEIEEPTSINKTEGTAEKQRGNPGGRRQFYIAGKTTRPKQFEGEVK